MIGDIGIYLSTAAIVAAAVFYFFSYRGNPAHLKISRYSFYVHTIGVVLSSVYLLYALLDHKFQYFYVFAYTERDLELEYLISAFWAGQEGTLLFWALIGSTIGLVLIKKEKQFEAPVMTFICVGQFFLLLFLVVESPFRLLPQVPPDGAGLNPLLLDPWMVVHPPIVFIGYALFLVPYAFALAALWKGDSGSWVDRALPWALLGWLFLGAGIFVGGYWAYRVLGWGGYWSWDPVENASLVPWLTGGALIHGLLVQKRKGKLLRTNILLSIVTFVLIVYATFLTRSGVLQDFSVHSFAETPLTHYLVAFMLFFLAVGLGMFFFRFKKLQPSDGDDEKLFSRYGLFVGGISALTLSAAFVALGTSAPALTTLLGQPSTVEDSFYVITNFPVAVLALVLLAFVPYLPWKREAALVVLLKAYPAAIAGLGATVFAYTLGITEGASLLYIFAAGFALAAGLLGTFAALRSGGLKISGGHIAHAGVALMLVGVIASMGYSTSEIVSMSEGDSRQALGYELSYVEKKHVQNGGEDGQDVFLLEITEGESRITADLRMYYAGREPRLMREPSVHRSWWGDLYVSPMELQERLPGMGMEFTRGQQRVVQGMNVELKGFEVPEHGEEGDMEEEVKIAAVLEVTQAGGTHTLEPVLYLEDDGWAYEGVQTPNGGKVFLERVDPERGIASLRFASPFDQQETQEFLVVELSRKPLIPVLAAGTVLIMAGTLVAYWRRNSEVRRKERSAPDRTARTGDE